MIKSIKVSGFKTINECELELTPLTILTGANSSGKSSIIQAIMLLAKNNRIENYYSMAEMLGYLNDFHVIRNKKTNAKNIKIETVDQWNDKSYIDLTAESYKEQNIIEENNKFKYLFEARNNEKELFYLNANRLGAQDNVSLSERKIGNLGEFVFSTFHKMKLNLIDDDLIKIKDSKTLAYQLSYWLEYITDIEMELITTESGDKVNISYKLNKHEENIIPSNLGAGISYLAKVIIVCFMAKKGDLILLENPEIQLHPRSQAKLGEFLSFIASNGIQLIVETHCEHLINRIRVEISENKIDYSDVIIHYKPSSDEPFQSLYFDDFGHFVDKDENRLSFPKNFFDVSVDSLLKLR